MPQTNGFIKFIKPYRGKLSGESYYQPGDVAQLAKANAHALVDAGFAEHVLEQAEQVPEVRPFVLVNPYVESVPMPGPSQAAIDAENAAIAAAARAYNPAPPTAAMPTQRKAGKPRKK